MKQTTPHTISGTARRPATPWRLALATLSLALAGAALQPAFAQPADGHRGGHGGGHEIARMLDSVNASDAQRSQIKQIKDAERNDLKPLMETGRQLRQQGQALFAMPSIDANAAESLRQQELVLHDQATKRMLQARLDVSAVLTPEQRKLMADRMAEHMAMHQQRGAAPR